MGDTKIQWTNKTWSPLRVRVKADAAAIAEKKGYASLIQIATKMAGHVGPHCERVSHGCDLCYSDTNNGRCLPANGTGLPFDRRSRELVDPFVDEKILIQPLKWRKPQRIFVENQSDLFGDWVADEMLDRVFAVMSLAAHHQFQILTKRPERMLAYCQSLTFERMRHWMNLSADGGEHRPGAYSLTSIAHAAKRGTEFEFRRTGAPPLPNVWLGVSCEDFPTWDARVHLLKATPAAKRFVSYEPALADLGSVDLEGIDWLIGGYESGAGARPAREEWIRSIKNQCATAGTAFFYKQYAIKGRKIGTPELDGQKWMQFPDEARA